MTRDQADNVFQKVLIANRGEIAVRITKTLQAMGLEAIAIYGEPDAHALHVQIADCAYGLPGKSVAETYLNIPLIIETALKAGAQAIHPGYGFLSENAAFAQACLDARIVFIGPSPDVIAAMGDKLQAKAQMAKAGVPVLSGWSGGADNVKAAQAAAQKIGYPVLVKAAAGGGGKGMRLVESADDLAGALESASREARNAFGDARVFLEKYIVAPRHIEFQILGDKAGHTVHLFERDCSIQRRHQKIIEESPAPGLPEAVKKQMGQAAVKAAKAIGYTNAGTVEFIYDPQDRTFYFLEVNTRLQVEHPVTECVTGLDLVRLQVEIAQGKPLPFAQCDITQRGHALECRIYAEDPGNRFLPSIGKLTTYTPPSGPMTRMDSGVLQGSDVSVYYDPMLAKLITWGADRRETILRMQWALSRFKIKGIVTNIGFLHALVSHPAFLAGEVNTHFLNHYPVESWYQSEEPAEADQADGFDVATAAAGPDPWLFTGKWRHGQGIIKQLVPAPPNQLKKRQPISRHLQTTPAQSGNVIAPMPGTVLQILVMPGDTVTLNQPVIVLESMKMEMVLNAPAAGTVTTLNCVPRQLVEMHTVLVQVEPQSNSAVKPA